ncbi:MAG: hypothetical protein JXA07_01260 [Spirochaetes bacterium]|nr:hypothetical protein [Spirochaetota bacterium]
MKKNRILIYLSAVVMAGALAGCENNIYSDEEATNMALLMASMSQNAATMASEAQGIQSSLLGIGSRAAVQGSVEEPMAPGAILFNPYRGVWHGPDLEGWWTNHYVDVLGYSMTLKIRRDYPANAFEYQLTITYKDMVTDFSYNDHLYIAMGENGLVSGYYYMNEQNSEASVPVQEVNWKFDFSDWNPVTGAGTFNFEWDVDVFSGTVVDYHQSLDIVATAIGPTTLHSDVTVYAANGITVLDTFTFELPIVSVEISPILFNN